MVAYRGILAGLTRSTDHPSIVAPYEYDNWCCSIIYLKPQNEVQNKPQGMVWGVPKIRGPFEETYSKDHGLLGSALGPSLCADHQPRPP